jgi:hypothetical protein
MEYSRRRSGLGSWCTRRLRRPRVSCGRAELARNAFASITPCGCDCRCDHSLAGHPSQDVVVPPTPVLHPPIRR